LAGKHASLSSPLFKLVLKGIVRASSTAPVTEGFPFTSKNSAAARGQRRLRGRQRVTPGRKSFLQGQVTGKRGRLASHMLEGQGKNICKSLSLSTFNSFLYRRFASKFLTKN